MIKRLQEASKFQAYFDELTFGGKRFFYSELRSRAESNKGPARWRERLEVSEGMFDSLPRNRKFEDEEGKTVKKLLKAVPKKEAAEDDDEGPVEIERNASP